MRRTLEWTVAFLIAGLAAVGVFGPSLSASGQVPPRPTVPSFTTPSFTVPVPPTMPPFTRPTVPRPPPTMPPSTTPPTGPPPTMPPVTQPDVTLPPSVDQAIEDVIDTLERLGDQFAELIVALQQLLDRF